MMMTRSAFPPLDRHDPVYLDIDENPATGHQGTDSVATDDGVIGNEYTLLFRRSDSANLVAVLRITPSGLGSNSIGTVPITFLRRRQ
jgi:hypothetical protein